MLLPFQRATGSPSIACLRKCKLEAKFKCPAWSPSFFHPKKCKQETSCKCLAWSPSASCLTMMAAAKSLQLCLTLCDPIDSSPPGSAAPGILQARALEWVAVSFSNALKWKMKVKSLSLVPLLATPWTAAHQAPLSMGFSRQEYWSGVPLPSPTMMANWCKSLFSATF